MDKYRRVAKPKSEEVAASPNELRITQQGKPRGYIAYAQSLLTVRLRYVILGGAHHDTLDCRKKEKKRLL